MKTRQADRTEASALGTSNTPDTGPGISFIYSFVNHSFKNINPVPTTDPAPVFGAGDGKVSTDGNVPILRLLTAPWRIQT